MNHKKYAGVLLIVVILLSGTLISCGPPTAGAGLNGGSEFEVIRQAADAYLSSGKADDTILGEDVWALISDGNEENDPRILSVRDFKHYALGHICPAKNAPWRQLFVTLSQDRLDTWFSDLESDNQQIVVYSYTGQEGGGQTTAFLNMLGWDAINLKWGFTVWML